MRNFRIFLFPLIILLLLNGCSPTPFDRKFHIVKRVVNGNTLEVSPQIYLKLIGIQDTRDSKLYLEEQLLGKRIRIRYDSHEKRDKIRPGHTLYVYAVSDKRISINAEILKSKFSTLNPQKLVDSLTVFKSYSTNEDFFYASVGKENFRSGSSQEANTDFFANSITELVKKVEPSVFLILTADEDGNPLSQGSGFFIGQNGIGVSNLHVFEGGKDFFVKTFDRNFYKVTGIYAENKEYDYIIFQVENNKIDFPYLKIGIEKQEKGVDIFVLGNPQGLESTLTKGIVSSLRSEFSTDDYIQFDAAVSQGSSGSPLCNMRGEAIGVVVSKRADCENCNFAIRMNIIKKDLDKIIN